MCPLRTSTPAAVTLVSCANCDANRTLHSALVCVGVLLIPSRWLLIHKWSRSVVINLRKPNNLHVLLLCPDDPVGNPTLNANCSSKPDQWPSDSEALGEQTPASSAIRQTMPAELASAALRFGRTKNRPQWTAPTIPCSGQIVRLRLARSSVSPRQQSHYMAPLSS